MVKRTEGHFRGFNDFELFYQAWINESDAKGTLILTHGIGEHSEAYTHFTEKLLPGDWDVYAWDLRGHGRSEGKRGYVKDFTDYSNDLPFFIDLVKKNSSKPLVLLGHSMGGLVNTRALIDHGDMGLKAAAYSSPLFGISLEVPKFKDLLARTIVNIFPTITMHNEINYADLSHDNSITDTYGTDPLRHDKISPALYLGFLDNFEFCTQNANKLRLPILMQQAGTDKIVSQPKAAKMFEAFASEDKQLIVYDKLYHEIYNEIERESVINDLKKWLRITVIEK